MVEGGIYLGGLLRVQLVLDAEQLPYFVGYSVSGLAYSQDYYLAH